VNNVEWRRSKVQELASQGYNQSEISRILQISQPTIKRLGLPKTTSKTEHQKIH
jgi:DNA-binding CsgD family transcriptional regulator